MKKIFLSVTFLLVGALSFGLYHYFKPPINLKNYQAEIILSATELKEQLAADTSVKNRLHDKVILVKGRVSSVEQGEHTTVIIDSSIRGELDKNTKVPEVGQGVGIKGMLGGYDEFFEEVVLIKCQLVK